MPRTVKTSPTFQDLIGLLPAGANPTPDWNAIWGLWPELAALDRCAQDPLHHAEGNAGLHTRMVVEALCADRYWQDLPLERKSRLFWAAVLHDIGKPATTRIEDGRISSRGHSSVGAKIARELLWHAGAPFAWREEICGLIATHQSPFWLIERDEPERLAAEISWTCNTADLCLHARADARGRHCADQRDLIERVDLAAVQFGEAGCFGVPFPFANDESRVAAFTRPDRALSHVAHEEFSCTATLMCGLPGAGKDRWIATHGKGRPMISLDELRIEAGLDHGDNQGRIVQEARELARGHLRAGRDFIWNATNLTRSTRQMLLGLFRDYRARTEIVYVEVPFKTLLEQNAARVSAIPTAALQRHINRLEVPTRTEAHKLTLVLKDGKAA